MNKTLKFKIEGMTCAACSQVIEEAAKILSGLLSIQVNFATESLDVVVNEEFDLDTFHALLKKLGYRAIDPNSKINANEDFFFNRNFYKALIALILASLIMFLSMIIPLISSKIISHSTSNWIQAVLTSLILFLFGLTYVKAVWIFCRTLRSNMNTLIGLGALSAYFYSLYLLIADSHSHSYFEGTAFIIGFALLGHFLDDKAKTKARSSLSSLYKMQIKFASKIIESKEINTPVIDLVEGDIIRIRPGEKFPLDGEIIDGESHADESMITGESQAISKKIGAKIYGGSLNLEGSVLLKIESTLHNTFISQIVAFVEKAQLKKAPIQKYADKIVKYFVPAILVLAFLTFVIWFVITRNTFFSLTHMIAVLVIACPCALGLAVPMAIMLSTSSAAKKGLLVSGGDIIEKGSHINAIVFDKTGTLTEGRPELTSVILFEESKNENDLLLLAAICSQYSTHPLSQALFNTAVKRNLKLNDPDKFQSITGLGLEAEYNGNHVLLGNIDLLASFTVEGIVPESFYKANVGSYVFMAINKKLVCAFVISDPIKPDAVALIKKLKRLNLDVWMVTGDHIGVAHKIGLELGINSEFIRAQVKPVGKADFIEELQRNNLKVAMVGDGINDAPALSKANLSIAMGNGADVAIEAADVSVLDGKIFLIAEFFILSNRSMKIIKENLALSSLYNILCIPLAAGVFYPWYKLSLTPMWASLAMGLSSFSVIINSLRLKK